MGLMSEREIARAAIQEGVATPLMERGIIFI
jgi:hypothetical protein